MGKWKDEKLEVEEAWRQINLRLETVRNEERQRYDAMLSTAEKDAAEKYTAQINKYKKLAFDLENQYNELWNRAEGNQVKWTEEGKKIADAMLRPSPECTRCIKFDTCGLWRAQVMGLKQYGFDEENCAIKINKYAMHCDAYVPKPNDEEPGQEQDEQQIRGQIER